MDGARRAISNISHRLDEIPGVCHLKHPEAALYSEHSRPYGEVLLSTLISLEHSLDFSCSSVQLSQSAALLNASHEGRYGTLHELLIA